ncbi:MAG: undecaprenyldiphospho-muramoylpentapeptide beta-N-acetylglucosaminyltransferase [Chitinispirillales bacterium]|jgi:UDP-N-acetylglucosamine--N-acetylmuramyl-(pentapeptide) pyrophosphoryl-undecaprenol N-acetylglucosamine transferase|nr:undecaprenyldiphospho-muramoylpentapeptide beta-N-acetylglucosaminyltransferase [Chitinispirillales bacterium]
MKRILLTGGGTAGHVTPNIALIPGLRKMGFEIHYAGTSKGIERELIEKAGRPQGVRVQQLEIQYHCISAGKLRRYFDLKNFTDVFRIGVGFLQSLLLMIKIRPSVVFSKGGFVSCPVVWAAWFFGVPVVIHESDMTPGLANKLSIPFAKKVCFSFPETEVHLPPAKRERTGLPVREELFSGSREEGKEICGFDDDKPIILVMGGSLGSQAINAAVRGSLDKLLDDFNICHLCGKGGKAPGSKKGYCQFEYVNDELSHIFAMTDIVVSRSGATTLFELLALAKPSLLIPLGTAASRGDQILNAQSFEKLGYSRVLLQDSLCGAALIEDIRLLYNEREKRGEAMKGAEAAKAADKVIEVVMKLVDKAKQGY